MKKLEQIASKYSEKVLNTKTEKKLRKLPDRSLIPIPKKLGVKPLENKHTKLKTPEDDDNNNLTNKPNSAKSKEISLNTASEIVVNKSKIVAKEKKVKRKIRKEVVKIAKETSMSIDSLEECVPNTNGPNSNRNCQSVGINTELMCVPCVIYDNIEQKKENSAQKTGTCKSKKSPILRSAREPDHTEPKIELLYKNPTMLKSGDNIAKYIKEDFSNSNFENSVTPSTSGHMVSDEIDSTTDLSRGENADNKCNLVTKEPECSIKHNAIAFGGKQLINTESSSEIIAEEICTLSKETFGDNCTIPEEIHNLSEERFEENYERDISAELSNDSIEEKYDDENDNEVHEIECRHGSGETYTKFTEDPADLQEFMTLTDKLLTNDHINIESSTVDKDLDNFHTPKTNSIEAINNQDLQPVEEPNRKFSDTFEALKHDLKELLQNSKQVSDVKEKTDKVNENESIENVCTADREVDDMEHITVYKLKFNEQKKEEIKSTTEEESTQFRLPSISDTKTPGRRVECSKKKTQNIYKSNKKYKMLGQQTRTNKEYQTFIVKQNVNDSDAQSVSSDAPPLKLPRIEKKRLDYCTKFSFLTSYLLSCRSLPALLWFLCAYVIYYLCRCILNFSKTISKELK